MIPFKYRPEVDGLRAIAVVMVLLFHAGLGFDGGFVGVDVFFVISGFLITGLIVRDQDREGFCLSKFWVRRIKRIIPAATVVGVATLVGGYFVLLPDDYVGLARSLVSQQVMLANVYFWREAGYFAGPAELMPLLHMWSLAVEEQFYVLFPLLLMLLRGRRTAAFWTLAGLLLSSLAISQWAVLNYPNAAFFLLPSRAWELAIGCLVVYLPIPSKWSRWFSETVSATGLVLILLAGISYSSITPFPGIYALVPCVGTAMLIYANSNRLTITGALLAQRGFVFIGLISYSLYLWHWPILAFLRYVQGIELPLATRLSALAASFVCAILSWRFVETPFRRGFRETRPRTWQVGAVVSIACTVGIAGFVHFQRGFPQRLPADAMAMLALPEEPLRVHVKIDDLAAGNLPILGVGSDGTDALDFLLWGDSHAMAMAKSLDQAARKHGLRGAVATRSGVVPLLETKKPYDPERQDAPQWNEAVVKFIQEREIPIVFLAARWASNVEIGIGGSTRDLIADPAARRTDSQTALRAFEAGLEHTLDALREIPCTVYVIEQIPLQPVSPRTTVMRQIMSGVQPDFRGVPRSKHEQRQRNCHEIFSRVAQKRDELKLLDPAADCFDAAGLSITGADNTLFYRDEDHLSVEGAQQYVLPMVEPIMSEIAERD